MINPKRTTQWSILQQHMVASGYAMPASDIQWHRGLSKEGQSLAEGGPLVTVAGPLANTQIKVMKW